MAIDIADFMEDNDFYVVNSDKFKAYNLVNDTELIVVSEEGASIIIESKEQRDRILNSPYYLLTDIEKAMTDSIKEKHFNNDRDWQEQANKLFDPVLDDIFNKSSIKEPNEVKLIEAEKFPENPTIGIGLSNLIETGLSTHQIRGVITKYLSDFNVNFNNMSFDLEKVRGKLNITIGYN